MKNNGYALLLMLVLSLIIIIFLFISQMGGVQVKDSNDMQEALRQAQNLQEVVSSTSYQMQIDLENNK